MTWVRLYLIVEGETERTFAERALKPYLSELQIDVRPSLVLTNPKLGAKGGSISYARVEKEIRNRMKEDSGPDARFSTMLDFYALPSEFPGYKESMTGDNPVRRVVRIEEEFARQFGDSRFLPYLQLHEFEALLYCDLGEIEKRIEGVSLKSLKADVAGIPPEEINDGAETAPSRRLLKYLPQYKRLKIRVGALAACAIGIQTLRQKCPHFNDWLEKLENLRRNEDMKATG